MTLDVVIRNGRVIDGTGRPGFNADVGVKDGRIVEIGKVTTPAREAVNADGALVTPGYVDLHTHYDGQVSWDPDMRPSVNHGVTTAIMGNCGVGFAPVRKGDEEALIKIMEGVEDIPGTALYEGIKWGWESFPEYMDVMGKLPRTIDVGFQVPHNAVRLYVMGQRAVAREVANQDDIRRMQDLVVEAIEAGAMGFSTADTVGHRDSDGNHTYVRRVAQHEVFSLGEAMGRTGKGVLQIFNDFYKDNAQDFPMLVEWARRSNRPLSFTLEQDDGADMDAWDRHLDAVTAANAAGITIRPQVAARSVGALFTLGGTLNPLLNRPSYFAIRKLPVAEKVRIMRDPAFRAKLLAEEPILLADLLPSVTPRIDEDLANIASGKRRLFRMDARMDFEQSLDDALFERARREGRTFAELVYDILLEDEGTGLMFWPIDNYGYGNFDAVYKMLTHPQAILGLGDSGAHVGYISDADFPTYIMRYWARDRVKGPKLTVEQAVELQTSRTARHIGLLDRGVLALGLKADINVIDHAALGSAKPSLVPDLPAGSSRLLQETTGYVATFVSGTRTVENDSLTGERPGTVVRGARAGAGAA